MADTGQGRSGGGRLHRWLPAGLVALGPLMLFGPMLVRGYVLYWGTPILQFVPWRSYAVELVRQGSLPLWNPLLGMGAPLLANYQSALLYPPNWLLAFTVPGWGEGLLVLGHLIFAGLGTVLFLRRLNVGLLGQAVGGVAFASCSYLVARAGFYSLNAAAAYLPWLLLAADLAAAAACSGPSIRWLSSLAALAVVVGLQSLAGHAQTTAYSLVFAGAWSLWRAATQGGNRAAVRLVPIWMAGGILGAGLAAAQLLPTLEYFAESSRGGGLPETGALTYSFWPWRTLGLLLPGLFGSPATGDYWGYGNYWEDAVYLGVLPFLMALTAALRPGRLVGQARRARVFLLAAAAISLLLALGANTAVFPLLFRTVPFFDIFNAPTRINLITTFCLAILAALGAELWARPTGRALYWTRLGTAGAGAVLFLGVAAFVVPSGLRDSFGRSFALAGGWLLAAGLLALLWPDRVERRWVALVALVITLDLVVAGSGLNPPTSPSIYRGTTDLAALAESEHRLYVFPEAERDLKFERTHRFDSFQPDLDPWWIRESGLPNTTMLDGRASANNFDPLLSARYVDWIAALAAAPEADRSSRLRLMDVGRYADEVSEEPPWLTYVAQPGARRAWLVPRAVAAEDPAEALRRFASPDFDPTREVILETTAAVSSRVGGVGSAEVRDPVDPLRVIVDVQAPSGGWLLLSDAWYPGWIAQVDGAPADSYPADSVFRSVWVAPGSSTVEWTYRPMSFRAGIAATLVSGILLLGVVVLWLVRRRSA